jgi:glycolate oxidase FAD binding subunit
MGTGKPGSAAETIPAVLDDACADVTIASDSDAVGGRQPRFVAAPASTPEAAALLRAAAELGLTVVPRGSGSRLNWGVPPSSCDLIVDTRRLDRVIEHAAGDLVVKAQAGVRLDALADVLATAGQRLALDPAGAGRYDEADRSGTIGGLIATGDAGPLRYRYGSPRDLLIGITVVRADGAVAKSGGKVVKNVAGYDLGKLFAGSYGTLGFIVDATFRLHPKPDTSSWITVQCDTPQVAAEIVGVMADAPLAPSAIELGWPRADASISVSVLLEGDQASVEGRADRMTAALSRWTVGQPSRQPKRLGGSSAHPPLAVDATNQTTMIRVAFWAGQLEHVLQLIRESGTKHGIDPAIRGSAAGVLNVSLGDGAPTGAVCGFVDAVRAGLASMTAVGDVVPSVASAVVVWAPAEVRTSVDLWGPVPSIRLMRAVKDQFDPDHRLAPGRFAGGI